jgi:hypothetical protein
MDTFWTDFWNLGAAVRTVILFLGTYFIGRYLNRYLSYRSVKSIQRRIKYAEDRKLMMDNLAQSDRFVLLFSFQNLFGILFIMSGYFILQHLSLLSEIDFFLKNLILILLWFVVGLLSFSALYVLNKTHGYPKSAESINQKIATLKTRLSTLTGNKNANE